MLDVGHHSSLPRNLSRLPKKCETAEISKASLWQKSMGWYLLSGVAVVAQGVTKALSRTHAVGLAVGGAAVEGPLEAVTTLFRRLF